MLIEFLRAHQLNIMLSLGSVCLIIAFFVSVTRTLSKKRKISLILLELSAATLLFADRFAYLYRGNTTTLGYYMVRICNYLVFAMTLSVILGVTLYLGDMFLQDVGFTYVPHRIRIATIAIGVGEILLIISQFTGMYYTFDETNHYQRAPLFIVCYVIPLLILILLLSIIIQYYSKLNEKVRVSLLLFTFAPGAAGVLQVFLYGLSLTNIMMVGMAVVLYLFVLVDMNETVEKARKMEAASMEEERKRLQKLFDQTATAFVSAVETRDQYARGNSVKVAEIARRVAELSGKDPAECEQVYYAALLHDVGLIGIPDDVIQKNDVPTKADTEIMRRKPVIGAEILSSITEYPYLSVAARYSHERYNGTGYPAGLKGDSIPELARIVAVADAYVTMTSKRRYRDARPAFMAREAFVKGGGEEFDPNFADMMIKLIDEDSRNTSGEESRKLETEITCDQYRDQISAGIRVERAVTKITFQYAKNMDDEHHRFSAPSVILFDSFDGRVHGNERAIKAYQYVEYGELWFDQHNIQTGARKLQEKVLYRNEAASPAPAAECSYEIIAERYEDHLRLRMTGPAMEKEVIVALPGGSKAAYISLTGENCRLTGISAEPTGNLVAPGDIPRIASVIDYTDRLESDLKNVQVDQPRSASSEGVELKDFLQINFHTMSLPGAHLIWHCPYVVLFTSDDGSLYGKNYREYSLIKLNGETQDDFPFSKNTIVVKKTDDFPGWDEWKERNKQGMECQLLFHRRGSKITLSTKNLGIEIEHTTILTDHGDKVCVALTGDQVALTDIRIRT